MQNLKKMIKKICASARIAVLIVCFPQFNIAEYLNASVEHYKGHHQY